MNNPIQDAFAHRSAAAADSVDSAAGLDAVHRHNAMPRRVARVGATVAVAAAVIVGATSAFGGNSTPNQTELAAPETTAVPTTTTPAPENTAAPAPTTPTETVPSTTSIRTITAPPSTLPPPAEAPPIILVNGTSSIMIDGVSYASGLSEPVRDAIDDTIGGIVFQNDHGIFHRPAGSDSPNFITAGQLIDVSTLDGSIEVLLTRTTETLDAGPQQTPYRRNLFTGAEIALPASGGVEWNMSEGGFSGPNSDVVLSGGDGFCRGMSRTASNGAPLAGVPFTRAEPSCTQDSRTPTDLLLHVGEGRPDGSIVWITTEGRRAAGQNTVHFGNTETNEITTVPGAASGVPFNIDTNDEFVIVTTRAEVWLLNLETNDVTAIAGAAHEAARFSRSEIDLPTGLQLTTSERIQVTAVNNLTVVTAPDDPLNVRVGPGVGYPIVTELTHLTSQISNRPTAIRLPNGSIWYEITTVQGDRGWVNSQYLQQLTLVGTSTCQAKPNFPAADPALDSHSADLDNDGLADTVTTVATTDGSDELWVRVEFGNGGIADGQWTDFWELTPGGNTVGSIDLDHVPNSLHELIIVHSLGSSGTNYGTMHLSGCTWAPATFAGNVFGMTTSASAIATDWGCSYDTGALLDFNTRFIDFNAETWTLTTWHLDDGVWVNVEELSSADFPNLDPPALDPCNWT